MSCMYELRREESEYLLILPILHRVYTWLVMINACLFGGLRLPLHLQYFYLFINIGALVGPVAMTYTEKYVGYWLAYFLPTVVFLTAPLVLWVGRHTYVRTPPEGSVLSRAFGIWRTAARGRISLWW